jgi:hypothetical protein
MDRNYLKTTMEKIEKEKSEHAQKFGSHPVHQNCMPNFDQALGSLQAELNKLDREQPQAAADVGSEQ